MVSNSRLEETRNPAPEFIVQYKGITRLFAEMRPGVAGRTPRATRHHEAAMANPMTPRRTSATQSERRRTAIGSWWQASSRNVRPDESWYWEYWFERDHSPDLAFLIARRLRSLFRWLFASLRWSPTIEKASPLTTEQAVDTNAKPSERLHAAYPAQNGDIEITLAGMVQRCSQIDDATA